jgi:hypothetical protein
LGDGAAHVHKELAYSTPVAEAVQTIISLGNAAPFKKVTIDSVSTPLKHGFELARAHAPQLIALRLLVFVFEPHGLSFVVCQHLKRF